MRYFSMFSGIGGFELGIQNAYRSKVGVEQEDTERNQRQGLQPEEGEDTSTENRRISERSPDESNERPLCVGYSEIDKYAIATYEHNFKGHTNYGDATKIDPRELPDFDLLVGGFPCQAFSVAGKRLGFNDTRGTLFFDIARILAEKRPRHLVLENVKGLLSHDSGKTFQTILGVLSDLGYFVEWQVLNSKDFGVPQNRERVFIVGHLRRECGRQVFPITGTNRADTFIRTVRAGGSQSSTEKHSRDIIEIRPNEQSLQQGGDKPNGHNSLRRASLANDSRIRRLTPLECERLQGFPDNWTIGSDTQRYKQCGNAVTVNVVEAVISKLLKEDK